MLRVSFTKKEILVWLLLIVFFLAFRHFYLIKFREFFKADTLDILSKTTYSFSIFVCGIICYKLNYKFMYKLIFIYCGLLIVSSFIIPFIARNALFISLENRTIIMESNYILKLFNSHFCVVAYTYTIILFYFFYPQKKLNELNFYKKNLTVITLISLLISIATYLSGVLEKDTFIMFKVFEIDIKLDDVIDIFIMSLTLVPSYFILSKMYFRNGFVNIRILFLTFISLSFIISNLPAYIFKDVYNNVSTIRISYNYSISFFLATIVISIKSNLLEKYILYGYLKYLILIISIISTFIFIEVKEYTLYNIYSLHSIIGVLFSIFLIRLYFKFYRKPSLKKIDTDK